MTLGLTSKVYPSPLIGVGHCAHYCPLLASTLYKQLFSIPLLCCCLIEESRLTRRMQRTAEVSTGSNDPLQRLRLKHGVNFKGGRLRGYKSLARYAVSLCFTSCPEKHRKRTKLQPSGCNNHSDNGSVI